MEDANVAGKIVKAFKEWGCFRLVNHGVAPELMAEMMEVARALTADLPMEMKMRTTDPLYPPREVLEKYTLRLHELTQFLGRKLMEGLGMEGDLFKNYACLLKINKYSHGPETVGLTSGNIHTDPGFITLLQDDDAVNGLEVMDKITGEFIPLDHIPGSLVINLGDAAEVWSNGRFYIPKHRVQCRVPTVRRSIGYFGLAPRDGKLETPPEMVDSDHPCRYAPFDFEEYRESTRLGNGEVLQLFLSKSS
ncbi:2-oxoglutarate-dependent dioxygenase DAO-like [Salvia miltiorrhiza]|uniref:2-oxoglutarate-dependent dioxygenase DAO-like n=1 Tax=Salvia miltiorrhiza TaxID=226208 RepID=UPI0025AD6CE8|nr:2-oxoglutarate-dependent dioxygenase DAO-like [Salvia miltiorrhiza]